MERRALSDKELTVDNLLYAIYEDDDVNVSVAYDNTLRFRMGALNPNPKFKSMYDYDIYAGEYILDDVRDYIIKSKGVSSIAYDVVLDSGVYYFEVYSHENIRFSCFRSMYDLFENITMPFANELIDTIQKLSIIAFNSKHSYAWFEMEHFRTYVDRMNELSFDKWIELEGSDNALKGFIYYRNSSEEGDCIEVLISAEVTYDEYSEQVDPTYYDIAGGMDDYEGYVFSYRLLEIDASLYDDGIPESEILDIAHNCLDGRYQWYTEHKGRYSDIISQLMVPLS